MDMPKTPLGITLAIQGIKSGGPSPEAGANAPGNAGTKRVVITSTEQRKRAMGEAETGNRHAKKRRMSVSAPDKPGSGRLPCHVLLVDDEPAVLTVLQWALEDQGYGVTVAHGGRAALARLCHESFDVMITDLMMPDLDGLRLIERARKVDPEMKIIVMTGSPELVPGILSAGVRMDGFMIKPFGIKTLQHVMSGCAGGKDGAIQPHPLESCW
jgi:CheY-like chemotaxis protein